MKKTPSKKLVLNQERLRQLTPTAMARARGGQRCDCTCTPNTEVETECGARTCEKTSDCQDPWPETFTITF